MEEDISVQPTKMTKVVKVDHAGQTELKWFIPMKSEWNFQNSGLKGKF